MKVLVIYATAGAGHRKAAEAVYNGLQSRPDWNISLVDSLDYTSSFYKQLYSATYTFLITRIPWLWGIIFRILDWGWVRPLVLLVRRGQNCLNGQALEKFLEKEQFDYIVSTHFFPNEVTSHLKQRGRIKSKIIAIITDYDVHSIWLAKGIDHYCGACEFTVAKFRELGIPADKALLTGIPTDAKFAAVHDVPALKRQLGLRDNVLTVLVATGSFGIGPIEEIIDQLSGIQVVVVCGHNKQLYQRLSQKQQGLVKIFGLVNNMHELMAVSDVMITKPGGLSISEALVTGLPMIFFNAIPGQETNNVRVLRSYGVGIGDCPVAEMVNVLQNFQSSPADFQKAKAGAKSLGKPNAVADIIKLIK